MAKLWRLSWADRGLLAEAIFWLALARLGLLFLPFHLIAARLGQSEKESGSGLAQEAQNQAHRIGWAIQAIARRTPWESACLAQAISAKAMLRRRSLESTLYLGLARDSSHQMQAHAWLRCGPDIITGKQGHERFSVISFFAEAVPEEAGFTQESEAENGDRLQTLYLDALNPVAEKNTADLLQNLDERAWAFIVQAAQKQHVLTLLFARLVDLKVKTAVPKHLWQQMEQRFSQVTLQNLSIYRELHLINRQLMSANIPCIVLKGGYLATAVYPHIGQRVMGDLDLLLPKDKLVDTVSILNGLGWVETKPLNLTKLLKNRHHLPPFTKEGVNFFVEPHWHIAHPSRANPIEPEQLWHHTQTCQIFGVEVLAFEPHLQLVHLAMHAAYNHQFAFDLRSLCDIAMLIHVNHGSLDWHRVVALAEAWGWQRGIFLTLMLVREFWDSAVPSYVLDQLKPQGLPDNDNTVELAKRQLLLGRSQNRKVSNNFSKLTGNLSFSNKVKFAWSFVWPSRHRLAERYGLPENSGKMWVYYLFNARDLFRRNAGRLWRLLAGETQITEAAKRRDQISNWLK